MNTEYEDLQEELWSTMTRTTKFWVDDEKFALDDLAMVKLENAPELVKIIEIRKSSSVTLIKIAYLYDKQHTLEAMDDIVPARHQFWFKGLKKWILSNHFQIFDSSSFAKAEENLELVVNSSLVLFFDGTEKTTFVKWKDIRMGGWQVNVWKQSPEICQRMGIKWKLILKPAKEVVVPFETAGEDSETDQHQAKKRKLQVLKYLKH